MAAAAAACGDPAIEMRLALPAADQISGFDVSCIGAVEVIVRGTDRGRFPEGPNDPGQPADDLDDCIEISDVHSYAEVRRAIAGRFSLALPASGLAGVDVRGSTGTCKKDLAPGDPIFYASAPYEGGDELVLPVTPNLSCAGKRAESVRPVDLLALTRTGQCPALLADNLGGVGAGTIHPTALGEAFYDFGDDYSPMVSNVASLPVYVVTSAPSCIALVYSENTSAMTTVSCARRAPGICNTGNQIELPIIDYNVAFQAATVASIDQYGGWVIGGVWGTDAAGAKIKLSGATIRPANAADADRAKIVYADYPTGAAGPRELAGATATNATGLFIAYVGSPIDFVISAAGYRDETVRMGSANEPGTALILMTKR
ncbi:MAG TPA: hypothetical protein VNO30_09600 [Kofleriaceae bacterium]|nr:hypothetical protein [Kofleriaceae bacterium]